MCCDSWGRKESDMTLCDPVDCSPPGSSVYGILQARILEWAAISCFRGSSLPRDQTPALAGGFFTSEPPGKPPPSFSRNQVNALTSTSSKGRCLTLLFWLLSSTLWSGQPLPSLQLATGACLPFSLLHQEAFDTLVP